MDFAINILRENNSDHSFLFSPIALGASLATIHYGAIGRTQWEITNLMYPGRGAPEITRQYTDLMTMVVKSDNIGNSSIDLKTMNRMVLAKGYETKIAWREDVEQHFGAIVENCDFERVEEVIRMVQTINEVCREKTNHEIGQVVTSRNFQLPTAMPHSISISVGYFKGLWPKRFKEYQNTFFGARANRTETFLHQTINETFSHFYGDVQLVGIPYKDRAYILWIFLPAQGQTLKDWLKSLPLNMPAYLIREALTNVREKFHIQFPKIRQEGEMPVKRTIESLGVSLIFTKKAGLGDIATPNTHTTDIVHKAFIEIDGESDVPSPRTRSISTLSLSSSHSSTSSSTFYSARPPPPPVNEFNANRPFLYMITYDKKPIFCGTYC